MTEPKGTLWRLLRADIHAMVPMSSKSGVAYGAEAVLKALLYARIRTVVYFRLSQTAWNSRFHLLAYWLMSRGLRCSGAEIHPAATIGPGFCLMHSGGVVIGGGVRVGSDFFCYQGVTLGDRGDGGGHPTIGDSVTVAAGAKLLGGITVGSGATVGANSVVINDVSPGSTVVGAPARVAHR